MLQTLPFLSKRTATGEGGLISGTNPASFTASDPLRLWIIQVVIIIIMAELLYLVLRRLRQPKVVTQIIGGILLGPTALGRIPGFTEHIFPPVSLPYLSLAANIGLCLFLFLVGLAMDTTIIKRKAHMSAIVSLTSIALPFGIGSALSIPLYHHFVNPSVHSTYFVFFIGLAYSITAFPVLCPMLTELNLINTHTGVIVLSAGFGNAIVGWILLALGVALVNAASGLIALWILFVCVAFTILLIPLNFVLRWLARKTGSIENGPSVFFMTVVMVLLLACCFFTDSIGVNAILGAFLFGLAVPRDAGLTIALTEKLEDMVTIIFLPLYFTFSGLNTNLWLLDNGITWAFTILIIAVSFTGKFSGCTIAAKFAGCNWPESRVVGAFMSCKGLLELIVLNVGLQAGVLSQRVFSMFVLEALTLTCMTTPLVAALSSRIRAGESPSPLDNENGQPSDKESVLAEEQPWRHRFTVVLDKLDHLPGAMAFTQLVLPPRSAPSDSMSATTITETSGKLKVPFVSVEALQLIELSERTSAMMKSSAAESMAHMDPILAIFRMFGELNQLAMTTSLSVVLREDFTRSVAEHAHKHASHLVLLPWSLSIPAAADAPEVTCTTPTRSNHNPFGALFGSTSGAKSDKFSSVIHSQFVRGVFAQSKTDVALFINTGDRSGVGLGGCLHVFLPFFGGPDDRLALDFVVQLCLNPRITATVVRIMKQNGIVDEGVSRKVEPLTPPPVAYAVKKDGIMGGRVSLRVDTLVRPTTAHRQDRSDSPGGPLSALSTGTVGSPDTVLGQSTAQMRLESETADQIAWSKYASPPSLSGPTSNAKNDAVITGCLRRIRFSETHTPDPVHATVDHARALHQSEPRLLIVAGRSRRLARESHHTEVRRVVETCASVVGPAMLEGMRKTIGNIGTAMTVAMEGSVSAVVVLQAAHRLN